MQRKLLTILSLFLTPSLLLASGDEQICFPLYLVFIVPFVLGILDHYIIKKKYEVKRTKYIWSIAVNFFWAIIGFPIITIFGFSDSMIWITTWILFHLVIRLLYFRYCIVIEKNEFPKVELYVVALNTLCHILAFSIIDYLNG